MKHRIRIIIVWALVVLLVGSLGFVAGKWTLAPPSAPPESIPETEYTVAEATIERSSTHRVSVYWQQQPIGYTARSGTVTATTIDAGGIVQEGDVLYRLDERPVVIMKGETPAYRDLSQGSKGNDVAQLQEALRSLGYFSMKADGNFGASTTNAVKRWQKDLGLESSGQVLLGDIVFSPSIPTRVILGENVTPGQRLSEGDKTVETVSEIPSFRLEVDGNSTVPAADTPVTVIYENHEWQGMIGSMVPPQGNESRTIVEITSIDEQPLCQDACSELPLNPAPGQITARVVQIPKTTGTTVPVSSLGQSPTGEYYVQDLKGQRIAVDVVVTYGSRAIVTGVEVGQVIRVIATDSSASKEGDS